MRMLTAVMLGLGLLFVPAPAMAQAALSPGCQALNAPAFDGFYSGTGIPATSFFAGERVTVEADPPNDPTFMPQIFLHVEGAGSQTTSFPGTLSYTFPANALVGVAWGENPPVGNRATWAVSCTAAAYPLAVSVSAPAEMASLETPTVGASVDDPSGFAITAVVVTVGVCAQAALTGVVRRGVTTRRRTPRAGCCRGRGR